MKGRKKTKIVGDKIGHTYPVLNGYDINPGMVYEYQVDEGQPVILCSDGYPHICNSLEESEIFLSELLQRDNLLILEYKAQRELLLLQ